MIRTLVGIAAMIVVLSTGWLVLNQPAAGTVAQPSPLRVILSIVLIFGIAFLGAALALLFTEKDRKP